MWDEIEILFLYIPLFLSLMGGESWLLSQKFRTHSYFDIRYSSDEVPFFSLLFHFCRKLELRSQLQVR